MNLGVDKLEKNEVFTLNVSLKCEKVNSKNKNCAIFNCEYFLFFNHCLGFISTKVR